MFYLVLQDGKTALMGACAGGHFLVAQYLTTQGVDIDATDYVSCNICLQCIHYNLNLVVDNF